MGQPKVKKFGEINPGDLVELPGTAIDTARVRHTIHYDKPNGAVWLFFEDNVPAIHGAYDDRIAVYPYEAPREVHVDHPHVSRQAVLGIITEEIARKERGLKQGMKNPLDRYTAARFHRFGAIVDEIQVLRDIRSKIQRMK